MRSYQCYVYFHEDTRLVQASHYSCWSMVHQIVKGTEIYIANFDYPLTVKYQRRLIWLINRITPCSIVEKGDIVNNVYTKFNDKVNTRRFIKYTMLFGYNQNLVLLNFIRNLWYEPIPNYTQEFFAFLKMSKKEYKDPLARLTLANKLTCQKLPDSNHYYYGHCNVHQGDTLTVKTTEQLLQYTGNSTAGFLQM